MDTVCYLCLQTGKGIREDLRRQLNFTTYNVSLLAQKKTTRLQMTQVNCSFRLSLQRLQSKVENLIQRLFISHIGKRFYSIHISFFFFFLLSALFTKWSFTDSSPNWCGFPHRCPPSNEIGFPVKNVFWIWAPELWFIVGHLETV